MKKIVFDHFPKTGGRTIYHLLKQFVGAERISLFAENVPLGNYLKSNRRFDVISGHFHPHPGAFNTSFFWITILRNPLDRVLSEYYFFRENVSLTPGKMPVYVTFAKNHDFAEYINYPDFFGSTQNAQAKHFASYVTRDTGSLSDDDLYQAAHNALNQFDIVGVTNKLDDFLICLCYENNWKLPDEIPRINVTNKRVSVQELPPEIKKQLEHQNHIDQRLFSEAQSLLGRKKWGICSSLFLIRSNGFKFQGNEQETDSYESKNNAPQYLEQTLAEFGSKDVEIISATIYGQISPGQELLSGEICDLSITVYSHIDVSNLTIGIGVIRSDGSTVFGTNTRLLGYTISMCADRQLTIKFKMRLDLSPGSYHLKAALHRGTGFWEQPYFWKENICEFNVSGIIGVHFEGTSRLYPLCFFEKDSSWQDDDIEIEMVDTDPYLILNKSEIITDFKAEISLLSRPSTFQIKSIMAIPVQVTNLSDTVWPASGYNKVCLCYHWNDIVGNSIVFDGLRTHLPYSLSSNDKAKIDITVQTPSSRGRYQLVFSLVQEGVAWFEEKGFIPPVIEIDIN